MGLELNYKLIGVRLRAARQEKGYTQEHLAELAGISAQHCSGIECGNAKVSLPSLIRLCNALDVTADKLLMDSVPRSEVHLTEEAARVFSGCSSDEMFYMLSVAESLKKALRIKSQSAKNFS